MSTVYVWLYNWLAQDHLLSMILAIENDPQAISYVSYLLQINLCNAFEFLSSIPPVNISKVPVAL